jgi:hypothetical protein
MPPNKYPKGTYGRSFVSQSCAIGVHASANGRDFFNEIEQLMFWNLTGESVESFLQIVRDVGPTVSRKRGEEIEDRFTILLLSVP